MLLPSNMCSEATSCASIGLEPRPAHASLVDVRVTLPVGAPQGDLFLGLVTPFG